MALTEAPRSPRASSSACGACSAFWIIRTMERCGDDPADAREQRHRRPQRGPGRDGFAGYSHRRGRASKNIKYVVFITKENHTYDTIFDRVPGARHDPSLLRWGLHQTVEEKRPAHPQRRGSDGQSQRAGAPVHGQRQLLYGARGIGRRASLAGGCAAQQPDADDVHARLVVQ